jgi:hypothetical protein
MTKSLLVLSLLLLPALAHAGDLERLTSSGYAVVAETRVEGTFDGCAAFKGFGLANGQRFVCDAPAYHFAIQPQVLVLRRAGATDEKVLIDGVEIAGKVGAPEKC